MAKKRITLFCSSYPPETGAAPGRMYQLSKTLQENGYEVSVITAMPNYPTGKIFPAYSGKLVYKENIDGIKITRVWLIPTNSSFKMKRLLSLLSYCFSLIFVSSYYLFKSKPDIIFVSSPPFATGAIGTLLSKCTKAKIVLNVSDLWPKTAFDLGFFKEGFLYNFLLRRERKMYARADAFSVQSNEIATHIRQHEPGKKIFVYRNLQPAIPKAYTARPEGKRKIIYAGLLGIAQGVFNIISRINFAEWGTELHLYGAGNELDKITAWIKENPANGVVYMGSVPAKEIPEIAAGFHAMLIPLSTTIEGAVPSKIFNAMVNGLPVLFSGNGEAADIVGQNKTGLVSPAGDINALKLNIEKLVQMSPEDYETMRQNCLSCSENEFSKTKQDIAFMQFLSDM